MTLIPISFTLSLLLIFLQGISQVNFLPTNFQVLKSHSNSCFTYLVGENGASYNCQTYGEIHHGAPPGIKTISSRKILTLTFLGPQKQMTVTMTVMFTEYCVPENNYVILSVS